MTGRRGQTAIELGLLLVIAVAAFVAMWGVLRNAIAGRFRQTGDSFSYGLQYDPDTTRIRRCLSTDGAGACVAYEP